MKFRHIQLFVKVNGVLTPAVIDTESIIVLYSLYTGPIVKGSIY